VKRAIISDIHGNFEALTAVMADIKDHGISEIFCLGDVIGYGPDPIKCLDIVMDCCNVTILGNHDQAVLFDPEGFNPVALRAIYWTRDQLESGEGGPEQSDRRWDFVGELPRRMDEGNFLFVHGSPRDSTNEYVFPEHAYEVDKMNSLMSRFEGICFQGHTHIPGVFALMHDDEDPQSREYEFLAPEEREGFFRLDNVKAMINVGSVGQPRDENPKACYVILDPNEKTLEYRRVEYDVETTRKKIHAIDDLDNMLGDRLIAGR
jgi:predicted phosphodiesterase